MITIFTVVAALVAVVLALIVIFRSKLSNDRTVPGLSPADSKGNGNFSDIKAAGSLHEFLMRLHKHYGPIASFWYGPTFTVSVASPDIFKDLSHVFDRPPELFRSFEPLLGHNSIQFCNGTEGKTRRRTTNPAFGHEALGHFCGKFNKLGEETVNKLASLLENEHVPVCQYSLTMSMKGLAQTSFGAYLESDEMYHKLRHNDEVCWQEMQQQVDGNTPEDNSERHQVVCKALETIKSMVKDIIRLRLENPPQPEERVFIDILTEHPDIYPESKLLDEVITYLIGGFHTSGHLLAWTLYFLSTHKDVQEKVFQEVISVVGKNGLIGPENVKEFQYLKQVINESLRVSLLSNTSVKVQDVDIQLGGYGIPKGTPVIAAMGVVHQDETIWPLPNKFDPERFSKENVKQRHHLAFQPFGLPARICPGYRFAYFELTIFLAILVRNFKWSLVEGQVVERNYGLVTSPKEEIWAKVEKRE